MDELVLGLHGPTTLSPGQTLDTAISYASLTATTVEDGVLVVRLPRGAEHVDSTRGADAHDNLGATYSEQGRHNEAIAAFKEAIPLAPEHLEANWKLCNTARQTKASPTPSPA